MWKKLTLLYGLVRRDLRMLWFALGHPERPVWLRPAAALLLLYAISPIDLIPDFIPVIGLMDDLVLIPLAIGWLLRHLPDTVRRAAENRMDATTVTPR